MRTLTTILSLAIIFLACKPSTSQTTEPVSKSVTASKTNTSKVVKLTDEEWRKKLTPEQYHVLREKGTDRPFTGKLTYHKEKGVYTCAACGNELFTSDMKFDSRMRMAKLFDREIEGGKIKTQRDTSHGMVRIEIMCRAMCVLI